MSVICFLTLASGILFSKFLLFLNFPIPMWRYGLAVIFSYSIFFALIYLWLQRYFGLRSQSHGNSLDALDLVDVPMSLGSPSIPEKPAWGGGGKFSGAGATSSWDSKSSTVPKSSSGSSFNVGDLDEGIVVVLFAALVAAIFGSTFYIVYQAPEILFEAAFEVVLVAGLLKKTKAAPQEGWSYSIFKRTALPFGIVLALALGFGFAIRYRCPEVTSFAEYRKVCKPDSFQ